MALCGFRFYFYFSLLSSSFFFFFQLPATLYAYSNLFVIHKFEKINFKFLPLIFWLLYSLSVLDHCLRVNTEKPFFNAAGRPQYHLKRKREFVLLVGFYTHLSAQTFFSFFLLKIDSLSFFRFSCILRKLASEQPTYTRKRTLQQT